MLDDEESTSLRAAVDALTTDLIEWAERLA